MGEGAELNMLMSGSGKYGEAEYYEGRVTESDRAPTEPDMVGGFASRFRALDGEDPFEAEQAPSSEVEATVKYGNSSTVSQSR